MKEMEICVFQSALQHIKIQLQSELYLYNNCLTYIINCLLSISFKKKLL